MSDLVPLRGRKLDSLLCGGNSITDLEALRGVPLRKLTVNSTRVTDLSPLVGMPLEDLNIQGLRIKSLEPLRKLPLRHLDLSGSSGDPDLEVLAGCRDLEEISIGNGAANVESLRALPKLTHLRIDGYQPVMLPAAQFWAEFRHEMEALGTIRLSLKKAGLSRSGGNTVTRLGDDTLEVALAQSDVVDLGFLRGMPVSRLVIYNTKVRDLSPLRGMPLTSLSAFGTEVTDLEPLRGLPLTWVNLLSIPATSVAALKDCLDLEVIALPRAMWRRSVLYPS